MYFKYQSKLSSRLIPLDLFSVKDITTANIQNIRTEEIELIDEEDTPPPVPDTPRRLQYDRTPAIPEEDSTSGKENKFRRKLRDGFVQMDVITNPTIKETAMYLI